MTKDVFECIKERRSIRKFSSENIPRATITRLLEAACYAPTAGNVQPWFFYVVEDREVKEKFSQAALGQKMLVEAPVVIVVCAELNRARKSYGSRGENLYALQDTAAAVENLMLAATALGIGSCWVGAFKEEEVASVLDLDNDRRPVALIPLGYPEKVPKQAPPRRPVEDIVTFL